MSKKRIRLQNCPTCHKETEFEIIDNSTSSYEFNGEMCTVCGDGDFIEFDHGEGDSGEYRDFKMLWKSQQ